MADRISRRGFLSAAATAGALALGSAITDPDTTSQEIPAHAAQETQTMPDELKNIEFWRASDTSDYKSIDINNYPALIIVESGPYEGIRLHTGNN